MFSRNNKQTVDTRMAVIEEKFNVYEKMMDKLENAIQTISEINQNISKMLTAHNEKIDQNIKTDEIIFKKFKDLEEKNSLEHTKVINKLEQIESKFEKEINSETNYRRESLNKLDKKIENLSKFRLLIIGGLIVISTLLSNHRIIIDVLTSSGDPYKIESVK